MIYFGLLCHKTHRCNPNPKKICCDCKAEKDREKDFYWKTITRKRVTKDDKTYKICLRRCKSCHNRWKTQQLLFNRAKYLYRTHKKRDKKFGFSGYDLTESLIRELISGPCSYCGSMNITMSLDRKNNSIGHTLENVLPSCIRCNVTRGNMPFKAWLIIAKAMKQVTELGLFDDWLGHTGSKNSYSLR